MKRWLVLLSIPLLILDCSNKKKGLLLLPFLGLGDGSTETKAEAASTGDGTFTVVGLETTDPTQVTAPEGNTTGDTTNGNQTTTTPEVVTPAPTTVNNETTVVVVDQTNGGNFNFETNVTVPVTVVVSNESGPVANAPVTVTETTTTGEPNVVGTGTTDSNGSATIPVSVPPTVTTVEISVVGVNPTTGEVVEITGTAPVQQPATGNGAEGTVVVAPVVNVDTTNFQPVNGCVQAVDTDCDGIANVYDEFPEDPSLASTARSGRYTIAFEDMYPSAGDADLNDHSTIFTTEMDKTPTNKVKTIRGTYTHVAKGAGYNHELRLSLDVPTNANVQVSYVDGSGNPWNGCASAPKYTANVAGDCTGGNLNAAQLKRGILLLPSSDKTLFGKKNAPSAGTTFTINDFVRGVTANVTITFEEPVDLNVTKNLVGGHLNYFLAINQKTDGVFRQIYRPGYYKDANGKDSFLDKSGFPWAIVVPGVFNHPTEGADIRKPSTSGYIFFNSWMHSNGVAHKDWYLHVDQIPAPNRPSYVVRVSDFYADNGFSAYLLKAVRKNAFEVSASLIVVGAALGFLMKKRLEKQQAA
ncbi:LruC domain-containing protein [Leptospira sp. 2 VSF19]|uniref:LruC domain-containing protein n=1 Tax=Leptospira soteropolitanensis TaxID=2950025 RepID=A0AAW5VKS7_9LEPT|nr:LruC domain-containing protein [Leptospira soteropolitanensis]MCW7492593.1 LruC domain-containing protein [Leptospira soteropolitanensis]MCW7500276.1 LruC domain-containing protein [Leptospira soteropolitanensis]MCW7522689.1 LruC domain-containing protein [Leptospira soteropolitanensis]MCW7526545.1 LruC domain-containing protein [Leptospira soteropolitanensis]MCW7530246.1 LruC domain-containing protein [Leptospira soteropolitanensis]